MLPLPPKKPFLNPKNSNAGFSLIIVISILALILAVVASNITLTKIQLQRSHTQLQLTISRNNAKLALKLLQAELSDLLSPYHTVTSTSSPNTLSIWNATTKTKLIDLPLNTPISSSLPFPYSFEFSLPTSPSSTPSLPINYPNNSLKTNIETILQSLPSNPSLASSPICQPPGSPTWSYLASSIEVIKKAQQSPSINPTPHNYPFTNGIGPTLIQASINYSITYNSISNTLTLIPSITTLLWNPHNTTLNPASYHISLSHQHGTYPQFSIQETHSSTHNTGVNISSFTFPINSSNQPIYAAINFITAFSPGEFKSITSPGTPITMPLKNKIQPQSQNLLSLNTNFTGSSLTLTLQTPKAPGTFFELHNIQPVLSKNTPIPSLNKPTTTQLFALKLTSPTLKSYPPNNTLTLPSPTYIPYAQHHFCSNPPSYSRFAKPNQPTNTTTQSNFLLTTELNQTKLPSTPLSITSPQAFIHSKLIPKQPSTQSNLFTRLHAINFSPTPNSTDPYSWPNNQPLNPIFHDHSHAILKTLINTTYYPIPSLNHQSTPSININTTNPSHWLNFLNQFPQLPLTQSEKTILSNTITQQISQYLLTNNHTPFFTLSDFLFSPNQNTPSHLQTAISNAAISITHQSQILNFIGPHLANHHNDIALSITAHPPKNATRQTTPNMPPNFNSNEPTTHQNINTQTQSTLQATLSRIASSPPTNTSQLTPTSINWLN